MNTLASRLKQLPFAAALLVVGGLMACGAFYWITYQQKHNYLTSRNFRLLAVLATQTEGVIADTSRRRERGQGTVVPRWMNKNGPALLIRLNDEGGDQAPDRVGELLGAVFTREKIGQGAFDTLAFATPDGEVAFATGLRAHELRSMDLAALLPEPAVAPASEGKQPRPFSERYSRKVTVQDAVIAGVAYKMFIQPCCREVEGAEPAVSSGSATPRAGAIVVGLVASDTLTGEAMAISPTLVVVASLLVVLAFLAWPFLNLWLHGPRQPITPWDALQLGFSGNVGLAIVTIVTLTSVQCVRLERDIDGQLEELARDLDDGLTVEIGGRFRQLKSLETQLKACVAQDQSRPNINVPCQARIDPPDSQDFPTPTDFNAAFLVGKDGKQSRKVWLRKGEPPLLDVRDRWYFRYFTDEVSRDDALRVTDCEGEPCVLESLVSWTTGEPSGVLAKPTGDDAFPVAGLGLPMRPVIKPVIPPGFEFAIIDKTGRVIFHSDVQRNNYEDLFLETDGNRQLRSLVGTGIDGAVSTEYWGRPYKAFVKHADVFGWTVVTLFDQRSIRGLMVEWTVASLLLLLVYAGVVAIPTYLTFTKGASWIWPDRFRRRRYWVLAAAYVVLLAAFAVVASWQGASAVVGLTGFVIPPLAWSITCIVLRQRPAALVGAAPLVPQEYCAVGGLLLVITGILPGVAFVAWSYDAHMEAYVKHRQLGVVQALNARRAKIDLPRCDAPADAVDPPGQYSQFLYDTTLCAGTEWMQAATPIHAKEGGAHDENAGHDLLAMLEWLLPYYSEDTVKLRELVHDRSDDHSWVSERNGGKLILNVGTAGAMGPAAIRATSTMPPLAIGRTAGSGSFAQMTVLPAGAVAFLFLGLFALAYAIAAFIRHFVFLGQVTAPHWALGRLAIPQGETVILVCDPDAMAPQIDGVVPVRLGPLVLSPDPDGELAQALDTIKREQNRTRVLLVTDLDATGTGVRGVAARARLLGSLSGSRAYTVIALSRRPLQELTNALRTSSPAGAEAVERLAQMPGVTMLDWRTQPGPADGPLTISSVPPPQVWWRRAWSIVRTPRATKPRNRRQTVESLLRAEERAHLRLRVVGDGIRQMDAFKTGRMSRAEVLEQVEEGAEALYTKLWNDCSDDEKLELRHIAQFGLANAGNRRAVRQLIARRLVTKDPDLRLMNQTFKRFVISSHQRGHIANIDIARIEEEIAPSTWDRYRTLFAVAALLVGAFLFTTQREMFNTTVGALVGVSTAVPSILKVFSLVAHKDTTAAAGQRNA